MTNETRPRSYWEHLQDARWQEKRLRVMEKSGDDGFTCMWCGAGKEQGVTLHVDHAYYRRGAKPWEYEEDTLWCLCARCHEEAGRLREEIHRMLARMHPAFLNAIGTQVAEIEERLKPYRAIVSPSRGPIHCRRCGVSIGEFREVTITPVGGEPLGRGIFAFDLDPDVKNTGRCTSCGFEVEHKGAECVDSYLPSVPAHVNE